MKILSRILVSALFLSMIVFLVAATSPKTVVDGVLLIPYTSEAPDIDGELDEFWFNVSEIRMSTFTEQTTVQPESHLDTYANYRVMWDEDYFYLFVTMLDDKLYLPDGDPWTKDNIEIFFDGDNSKNDQSLGYDDNDVQWRYIHGEDAGNPGPGEFAYMDTDYGYNLELAIPFDSLTFDLEEGTVIGWDLQYSDQDSSESHHLRWWSESQFGWNDPSTFGEAEFIDREVSDLLDVNALEDSPIIDGEDDDWERIPEIPTNRITDGQDWSTLTDANDTFITYKIAWNPDGLHLFVRAVDDIKYMPEGTDPWNQDNIEIFFDSDNSKNDLTTGYDENDVQWRYVRDQIPVSPFTASAGPGDFVFIDTDAGYNFELTIPASALDSTIGFALEEDHEFGWEIQISDKDSTDDGPAAVDPNAVGHKWWTTSNNGWNDPSTFGTAILVDVDDVISSVEEAGGVAPETFALEQNYPNPFNPSTTIDYTVNNQQPVTLSVFNLLGQEVARLVDNEIKTAGKHTVSFNASQLPSGVYFYKLTANGSTLTKKMLLMK